MKKVNLFAILTAVILLLTPVNQAFAAITQDVIHIGSEAGHPARTIYVDDDLADYPNAYFTSIRGIVNATGTGDTIGGVAMSPESNHPSAEPEVEWSKTFGGSDNDICKSVRQTSDGGYIIAGYTNSYGAGDDDVWLIKTDSNGDKIWDKTFGSLNQDIGYSVQQTSDGGYIITGLTQSYGVGGAWLIKTDSNGDKVWDKIFGGVNGGIGYSVQQTSDGGYIIVGYTHSYGADDADVWLIKTDSNGDKLWDKTFGGTGYEWGYSVQQTSDGGYIIACATDSYGAGSYDVWLIRTDSNGNKVWDKTLGGIISDWGHSVQQTSDGGYIIAGYTNSYGAGNFDFWLIKLGPEAPIDTTSPDTDWEAPVIEIANLSCQELSALGSAVSKVLNEERKLGEIRKVALARTQELAGEAEDVGGLFKGPVGFFRKFLSSLGWIEVEPPENVVTLSIESEAAILAIGEVAGQWLQSLGPAGKVGAAIVKVLTPGAEWLGKERAIKDALGGIGYFRVTKPGVGTMDVIYDKEAKEACVNVDLEDLEEEWKQEYGWENEHIYMFIPFDLEPPKLKKTEGKFDYRVVFKGEAVQPAPPAQAVTEVSPGKTVIAFWEALREGRYSDAEEYIAAESRDRDLEQLSHELGGYYSSLAEAFKDLPPNVLPIRVQVVAEEITSEQEAQVKADYYYSTGDVNRNIDIHLFKENGIWKIIMYPSTPTPAPAPTPVPAPTPMPSINPSFEAGTSSPDGWTWTSPIITWDSQVANTGQRSIRWSFPVSWSPKLGSCASPVAAVYSDLIMVDPTKTYKLSVWAKGSVSDNMISSLTANLLILDAAEREISWLPSGVGVRSSETWTSASETIGPNGWYQWPAGAKFVRVRLSNGFEFRQGSESCSGQVLDLWADDVYLELTD